MTNNHKVALMFAVLGGLASGCGPANAADSTSAGEDGDGVDSAGGAMADAGSAAVDSGPVKDPGDGCVPVAADEVICDGVDDDCNGVVDDVDVGDDGFCDCYTIGIIGTPGVNPSSDFDTWLHETGTAVTRIGTDPSHVLTADELAPFDIVILDRLTHAYSEAEAALLGEFVAGGRGLITMAGYANDAADRNKQSSLVRAVGVRAVAPIYLDPTEVWHNHPITVGAGDVQFYGGWALEAIEGESLGEILLSAESDSATLAVAKEYGDGRAFVYGDEWISFDSEWRAIPGVTTLWQSAIRWVGPKSVCFPIVE